MENLQDKNTRFSDLFEKTRLICIMRGIRPEQIADAADALCRGGVRLAEIAFDSAGNTPDSETAKMIATAASRTEGKMLIGAGTVLTKEQVRLAREAGGSFIVSPNTDPDVIRAAKEAGMISIPGAMTPSEILCAHRAGADYVKIFPTALLGGPEFFKAMKGPLPHLRLLAVYGVRPEEIPAYRAAGAYGFAIGGGIVNAALCAEGNYKKIEENARFYAAACAEHPLS